MKFDKEKIEKLVDDFVYDHQSTNCESRDPTKDEVYALIFKALIEVSE